MRVTVTDAQLRAACQAVRDDPTFAESLQLVERGERPSELMQALALRPELLAGFAKQGHGFYPGGIVERELKELVILEASRANKCQFCTNSHVAFARIIGLTDDPLRLLDEPSRQTERQRLALEYTRAAMADSNRVPDELFARLRRAFTDPEIVEITFLIGTINSYNIFNNCLQVTYHGEFDGLDAPPMHAAAGGQS